MVRKNKFTKIRAADDENVCIYSLAHCTESKTSICFDHLEGMHIQRTAKKQLNHEMNNPDKIELVIKTIMPKFIIQRLYSMQLKRLEKAYARSYAFQRMG